MNNQLVQEENQLKMIIIILLTHLQLFKMFLSNLKKQKQLYFIGGIDLEFG